MQKVLSIKNLRKAYGNQLAVDDISFEVGRGEIVGLLGSNGAGKTTTISMILGVLEPDSGSIHLEGTALTARNAAALRHTNFAAVYAPLPGNLTVQQNLRVFGLLYGVEQLSERMAALIRQFDLEKFRDVKCGVLSSGEQTRVTLAKAMLNRPRLLLLDEPMASLDPVAAGEIRARIRAFTGTGGAKTGAARARRSGGGIVLCPLHQRAVLGGTAAAAAGAAGLEHVLQHQRGEPRLDEIGKDCRRIFFRRHCGLENFRR